MPAETTIIASFWAIVLFWAWLALAGSWRTYGNRYLAWVLVLAFLGIGAAACWLLLKRRVAGAWLCVVFYGMQVLTFPLPIGAPFDFHPLPTIYYRLVGDPSAPISINVVGLVLFIVSLVVLAHYRGQGLALAQVPPNTSLERTREG